MKMIVGLGNPGQKYIGTRHNIGFEVLGRFAKKHFAPDPKLKFQAEFSEVQFGETKVILLCPLTYMNLSGQSVSQAASFYKVDSTDILVVCDDFNLEVNRIRFRPNGSAGGQNGLDDIIKRLGTRDFPRLRVGIGPVPAKWNPADFVLGKFTEEELAEMSKVVDRCISGLEDWIKNDVNLCMNRYNGLPQAKESQSKKKKTSLDNEKARSDLESRSKSDEKEVETNNETNENP